MGAFMGQGSEGFVMAQGDSQAAAVPAQDAAVPGKKRRELALLAGAGALLLGALGYAAFRQDGASQPVAEGAAPSAPDSAAELEAAARARPQDAAALQALAEARFDERDFDRAVTAYRQLTVLVPTRAGYWSGLGESLVMAAPNTGPAIPVEALAAFRRAISIDAKEPRARYFMAAQRDIDGDHDGAIADWLALLAETPRGAAWEGGLRQTIEDVGRRHNIAVGPRIAAIRQPELTPAQMPVAARAIPGPSRQDMQAAAALPKGQQDMMVNSMVDGLEARLKANPQQPDRWIMLMRSRMTLGESAKAARALTAAIAANPAQAERLRAEARLLGVPQN
jgi:cytochrome c-type biogenesis protein CcmH